MRWVWLGICLFIFALLIGVAVWVFLPGKSVLSASQKEAALRNLLGRDVHTTNSIPTTWTTYKSTFMQCSYPSWAKIYVVDNAAAIKNGALDSFSFNIPEEHVYAVIQVVSFDGTLAEYPAVHLRLLQDSVYTHNASISGRMEFSKEQDMVERSAFFQKSGKVVSVAVTGYEDVGVDDIYRKILATLIVF